MGICNIITIITGIKVDIPYNIINISLLVIAFLFLDKNFFIKTLIGIGLLAVLVPSLRVPLSPTHVSKSCGI